MDLSKNKSGKNSRTTVFLSDFPNIYDAGESLEKIQISTNQNSLKFIFRSKVVPVKSRAVKLCYGIVFVFPNPKSYKYCLFRQFSRKKNFPPKTIPVI